MSKTHPVFDSIWYNLLFSVIAVAVFTENLLKIISEGFIAGPTVMFIIWIIISFHFIQKLILCIKKNK